MTDKAIEAIRKEIVALTAENLAMQFVLTSLLQRISEGNPSMRRLILQALDEAANHAENFSLSAARRPVTFLKPSASSSKCG